jgi:hypothetical protein
MAALSSAAACERVRASRGLSGLSGSQTTGPRGQGVLAVPVADRRRQHLQLAPGGLAEETRGAVAGPCSGRRAGHAVRGVGLAGGALHVGQGLVAPPGQQVRDEAVEGGRVEAGARGLVLAVEGYDLGDENLSRITSAVGLRAGLELLGEVVSEGALGRAPARSAPQRVLRSTAPSRMTQTPGRGLPVRRPAGFLGGRGGGLWRGGAWLEQVPDLGGRDVELPGDLAGINRPLRISVRSMDTVRVQAVAGLVYRLGALFCRLGQHRHRQAQNLRRGIRRSPAGDVSDPLGHFALIGDLADQLAHERGENVSPL